MTISLVWNEDMTVVVNGHFLGQPRVIRYLNVSVLDFIRAQDDGQGCGDNWSYKTYKAPVKLSTPTYNTTPSFL